MSKIFIAFVVLMLAMLACGKPAEEWQLRGWTVTPSLVSSTSTPVSPTWTPSIVIISATPEPTLKPTQSVGKCVNALVAVHLRPSPSTENYPILPLPNNSELVDLGGRSGKWMFVQFRDKQGWVYGDYVGGCK